MMILLDANLFLRALTRSPHPDVQLMHQTASSLFLRAERGEVEVTTSDAIVAEVAFILTAKAHYHLPVDDAAGRLGALLRLPGVKLRNKRVVLGALDIWTSHPALGFVDALTASYAHQPEIELATFDTDFDQFPGISRWTPEDASDRP